MARNIKGITIELDGETKGLDKALKDVNKRSRDLNTELRDVEKLLKFNPGNAELVAQKQKLLSDQVETTSEKLNTLKKAQKEVQEQFDKGEINEKQYRDFQKELVETSSKLENFEDRLKTTQTKVNKFGDNLGKVGDKMKGIGSGIKDAGSSMTGFVSAPLIAGLGLATKGTEEFRQAMGRLETNAETAGIKTETINDAFIRLSGITDDADANVEALSNLLATNFDEQGLTTTLEALSGALIKFPDTLKIEGLADGLQETVATGQAIGPFAELLERLGINLDDFNTGLSEAAESGKTQDYILQTLASTGLTQVNEQYRKNNEELVKSKESTANFQQSMAELGETLSPIMTKITEKVTELVDWFNQLSPTGQNTVLVIAGIVAAIGPFLMIIGTLISAIGGIIAIAGTLSISLGAIVAPVLIVVGVIAALIAIGVALWKNWDTIKAKTTEFVLKVVTKFLELKDKVTDFVQKIKDWVIRKFIEMVASAVQKVKNFKDSISEKMRSLIDSIKEIWGNVMDFFRGIDLLQMGKDIIQGLINGVKKMASKVVDSVKDVVGGAIEGAKKLLGIHSPSRVFKQIGVFTGEGLANGMESTSNQIKKASQRMSEVSIPKVPKNISSDFNMANSNSNGSSSGNTTQTHNNISYEGLFNGANFYVNKEQDIEKLAAKLFKLMKSDALVNGVR
ncbi:phage tail tape measure protein [Aquibacillus kalidii]|uniref:hypothetical protein n=1 Tax=Aquibacillus kalidii TaxID=2762597 RepID=UPI001648F1D1|nr:hypothetical protein [Aquibacillus kalidii]